MKVKITSDSFYTAGFSLILLYTYLPVMRVLPLIIKGLWIMLALVLGLGGVLHRQSCVRLIHYSLLVVLCVVLDIVIFLGEYKHVATHSFFSRNIVMLSFWIPLILSTDMRRDLRTYNKLIRLILFLLIITSITTLVGSFFFPNASRSLADADTVSHRQYQMYNIGGYGFIYSLVMMIPYLVWKIKDGKKIRYIIILLLFTACIVKSNYMLAILLCFFSLFCSLFIVGRKKNVLTTICFFSILTVFYFVTIRNHAFWNVILGLVDKNAVLSHRIRNIVLFLYDGTFSGDLGLRGRLYFQSITAFLRSPIVGNLFYTEYNVPGGHSEILDLLAGTGILGLSLLLSIVSLLIKDYRIPSGSDMGIKQSYTIVVVMFVILASINTVIGNNEVAAVICAPYVFSSLVCETERLLYRKKN